MLETLDTAAVRRWCGGGLEALRAHQHEIDELNVYPVPDGDTGTNLVLTLASAQEALEQALAELEPDVAHGRIAAGGAEPSAADGPAESEPVATPLGRAMRRMARGALLGARGNSGVIVSQILRGMADSIAVSVAVRGAELARALRSASEAAYAAVARPVEGTVLSVVAAAADGAGRIKSDDLVAVARAAARSAAEALARTPQQLPVLARAGVVDAGGRGLCLLLDALVEALTPGEAGVATAVIGDIRERGPELNAETDVPATGAEVRAEAAGLFGYEVQYLLDAEAAAVGQLRQELDRLGDSLVVVGAGDDDGPALWNVHVHVPAAAIGPALEAGVVAGRPHRITVTPLDDPTSGPAEATAARSCPAAGDPVRSGDPVGAGGLVGAGHPVQAGRPVWAGDPVRAGDSARTRDPGPSRPAGSGDPREPRPVDRGATRGGPADEPAGGEKPVPEDGGPAETGPPSATPRGAVVVAAGDGLAALFEAEGATVVGRNPSIMEMVEAIRATGAGSVVLLPNDANTHAVASAAAREAEASGVRVSVVPTRSPVQALAALAVRDPGRPFVEDVIAMAEASGACRYGEVCTARRDSLTVAGPCREGDLLGLVDGEVHVIGADLEDVSRRLLDRMLGGGGELATLVLGADAPAALEDTLGGHVQRTWPFVEVQCYAGGQPRYHLLVGVE